MNFGALEVLIDALATGDASQAILNQEKRGQKDMERADRLPRDMNCTRGQLEALGFVFHEDIDDVFVAVTLPDGWAIKGTDHSMWSTLFDADGCVRANIFYKAAFYDRSARLSMVSRYHVDAVYPDDNSYRQALVKDRRDADTALFETDKLMVDNEDGLSQYKLGGIVADAAEEWLVEKYPDYRDPFAYWEDES